MKADYFEETQRIRDSQWAWALAIVIFLSAILPLLYGMYWQIGQGQPWGDRPMSDEQLILVFTLVTTCCGIGMTAFLSLTLQVRIDASGVHYRCIPHIWKWRFISREEIKDFATTPTLKWYEGMGLGYRRNRFTRLRSFRISSGKHVTFTLKNGERFVFGTRNAQSMEWAVNKMMSKIETI